MKEKPTSNSSIRRRLEMMLRVAQAIPKTKFRIGSWFTRYYFDKPLCVTVPDNFVSIKCKSVACMWGWCALDKGFRRLGLTLDEYGTPRYEPRGQKLKKKETAIYFEESRAGIELLGITGDECDDLFMPGSYERIVNKEKRRKDADYNYNHKHVEPRHVIKKIKALIKDYS